MATNNKQQVNIGAWDAMMAKVAGMPEIEQLVAEVDRLRAREQALEAENAAMRPIVAAVAEHIGASVSDDFRLCSFCANGAIESRVIYHSDDCEVEQARAFVAAHPAAGEAVESEGE